MEVIGDRNVFAIGYEILQQPRNNLIYGHFCFIIENKIFGDFDQTIFLAQLFAPLSYIIKDRGRRYHKKLFLAPAVDAFLALERRMFGEPGEADEIEFEIPDDYAVFSLNISVSSMRGRKIYMIESDLLSRILYRNSNNSGICEFLVKKNVVEDVFSIFFNELNKIYDRLSGTT